jgi:hypothetical protein
MLNLTVMYLVEIENLNMLRVLNIPFALTVHRVTVGDMA